MLVAQFGIDVGHFGLHQFALTNTPRQLLLEAPPFLFSLANTFYLSRKKPKSANLVAQAGTDRDHLTSNATPR